MDSYRLEELEAILLDYIEKFGLSDRARDYFERFQEAKALSEEDSRSVCPDSQK